MFPTPARILFRSNSCALLKKPRAYWLEKYAIARLASMSGTTLREVLLPLPVSFRKSSEIISHRRKRSYGNTHNSNPDNRITSDSQKGERQENGDQSPISSHWLATALEENHRQQERQGICESRRVDRSHEVERKRRQDQESDQSLSLIHI